MPLANALRVPDPKVISTAYLFGDVTVSTAAAGASSSTYPTATQAQFYPFRLNQRRTYTTAFWLNGATAAGNVDVGVYTLSGTTMTRVAASTATAQSGVSAIQTVALAVTLDPGLYYLAISETLATSTFWRVPWTAITGQYMGCFKAATSSPLPASVTATVWAAAFVPMFGIAEWSV